MLIFNKYLNQSDIKEAFIFKFYKLRVNDYEDNVLDYLRTDLRSMAKSWKLPCHIYAHYPLFDANNNIKAIEIGKNMTILMNYIGGICYKHMENIVYNAKETNDTIDINML